jgi:hypothetical protein
MTDQTTGNRACLPFSMVTTVAVFGTAGGYGLARDEGSYILLVLFGSLWLAVPALWRTSVDDPVPPWLSRLAAVPAVMWLVWLVVAGSFAAVRAIG